LNELLHLLGVQLQNQLQKKKREKLARACGRSDEVVQREVFTFLTATLAPRQIARLTAPKAP
jgi:hypothetical protein